MDEAHLTPHTVLVLSVAGNDWGPGKTRSTRNVDEYPGFTVELFIRLACYVPRLLHWEVVRSVLPPKGVTNRVDELTGVGLDVPVVDHPRR